MKVTVEMTPAEKWKWAMKQVIQQLRNRKKIDISKLLASARTTHNIKYIEELFESQEFQEARNVVDYTVKDIVMGKVADNHLIMDMAKLCVKNGIIIAKKGRVRYAKTLIDKAQEINEWFADRILRMIKTLSSAFNFTQKSETPSYVISLEALIKNAYGFIGTLFGKFEDASVKFRDALQLEHKLFERNMKDFMGLPLEKKFLPELGSGTHISMAFAHLHLAACFTSLREYQMARQEAKQAVNFMVEIQKDSEYKKATLSNQYDVQKKISDVKYTYAVALYNFGVGEMNLKHFSKGVGLMYKAYVVSQEALGENHRNTSKLKSLYIKARKKSYPGLGRYPSFDEPEKEHARYESKQIEKSCFPSGLYFKAFSRCIDSTYLLPYSYRLTHGINAGADVRALHVVTTENIRLAKQRRSQQAEDRDKWKEQKRTGRISPPTVPATQSQRRPSTASTSMSRYAKHKKIRPHTSSSPRRSKRNSFSSNNNFPISSPMKKNRKMHPRGNSAITRKKYRRRPRTANAINSRARRIYVKSQGNLLDSNTPSPSPRPPHRPKSSSANRSSRRRFNRPASASSRHHRFKLKKSPKKHHRNSPKRRRNDRPQSSPTYHTPLANIRSSN
jgi:hypothetical protein